MENLACLIEVRSTRQKIGETASEVFRRFYISSRHASAKDFAKWIRQHWNIENKCHWIADVIFKEDDILADRGNSAENLGLFRRLAMNMAAVAVSFGISPQTCFKRFRCVSIKPSRFFKMNFKFCSILWRAIFRLF